MLVAEGARVATALAHQNEHYPENTPDQLRAAAARLREQLEAERIPLNVVPAAEVVLNSNTPGDWIAGKLLSVADRGQFLLAEMPAGIFLDPRHIAAELKAHGIRLILAHAERYEELLHDRHLAEQSIASGCLLQVTAEALAEPANARDEVALRDWATRGMIHVICSDGHRIDRRQPRLRAGYRRLEKWIGPAAAERIGSIWGTAVLQGLSVKPPPPKPVVKNWFTRLFGA
jgi:protein-tyrosine phosphatase